MRSEIEEAVLLLQQGGDQALEQALALLQNTVFSFSMRICGQRQDAERTRGAMTRTTTRNLQIRTGLFGFRRDSQDQGKALGDTESQ